MNSTARQFPASATMLCRQPLSAPAFPRALDQHFVSKPIAAGGMASIHLAVSPDRRRRVLALKRLHSHLATDACFARMLLDEAAIASRIRHPNVVTTHGADMIGDETYVVMEYVPGMPLHVVLQKAKPRPMPTRLAVAIVADALRGLHAAHEALDADGKALNIVHRDVSPQNILFGADGVARVLDFGIAMADRRSELTRTGEVKGKVAYMAPEQLRGEVVDRRADIYSAAVVLWEALVGAPMFRGTTECSTMAKVLEGNVTRPGAVVLGIPPALDAIVMRGLAGRPADRFRTALEMATALDSVVAARPVRRRELAAWLEALCGDALSAQAQVATDLRHRRPSSQPPAMARSMPLRAMPLRAMPLRAMLATLDDEAAIRAIIFVIAIACGIVTEVALARAFHVRSHASTEEPR